MMNKCSAEIIPYQQMGIRKTNGMNKIMECKLYILGSIKT